MLLNGNLLPEEIIKVREWIPNIGMLLLFLDIVPSSFAYIRALRRCFRGGFVYVSLRFKAKENPQRCGDAFFYMNIKEAKELLS